MIIILITPVVMTFTFNKQPKNFQQPLIQTNIIPKFNIQQSQQYFIDYLKYLSSQPNPIALINLSASLPYQQALLVAFTNYVNQNNNQLTMIQEQKSRSFPRWDYLTLSKQTNSPINIINPEPTNNQTTNSIQNQKINVLFDQSSSFVQPNGNPKVDPNHLQPIFNYLKDQSGFKKLNLVLPDVYFIDLFNEFQPNLNNPLIQIIANAKSILLTTDGNGHIVRLVEQGLLKFVKSNKFNPQSQTTIKENLKNIQNFNQNAISKLTKNDIYNLLLLDTKIEDQFDFIHFVHYESSYINNLYTDKIDHFNNHIEPINNNYKWKVSSVSLNPFDYLAITSQQFVNFYLQAFFIKTKQSPFISFNAAQYDKNKPSIIFSGSALFPAQAHRRQTFSSLEEFVNLRLYVQKAISDFLTLYPPNQYNIIFKMHPMFSSDAAIKLTNLYLDNPQQSANIINPLIPFEVLLANEYNLAKNNQPSWLFFKTKNNQILPKFMIYGLQATTSIIHTTKIFLETNTNLNANQINQIIGFQNFPVPHLFDVISRHIFDPKKFNKFNSNINKITNLYRYFNPSYWNQQYSDSDRFDLTKLTALFNNKVPIFNDQMINIALILFAALIINGIVVIITIAFLTKKRLNPFKVGLTKNDDDFFN